MDKKLLKDAIGWGIVLWLIGYILGILLFMFVPPSILGWVIMPIGIAVTLWVLVKKIKLKSLEDYFLLAIVWTIIAVALDYLFLVRLLNPPGGYYKLDVYLYYILTFTLPLLVGWSKKFPNK